MSVQVTVVGLGWVGASIGLALAGRKDQLQRIGCDESPKTAEKALQIGAVDRAIVNLAAAVENADVVVLALPVDEIQRTLALIAPHLKPACVVLNTAPLINAVNTWGCELLPESCHLIGFSPTLNPDCFSQTAAGIDTARADLFQNSLVVLTSPPGCTTEAVRLAHNLALLLGATPLYADPFELDGLLSIADLLPKLLAASLLNAAIDQPGWQDASKIAGIAFAQATQAALRLEDDGQQLGRSAMLNRENALRVIDNLMAALGHLRRVLDEEDAERLQNFLQHALHGRDQWMRRRQAGGWDNLDKPEIPTSGEIMRQFLGLRGKAKPRK